MPTGCWCVVVLLCWCVGVVVLVGGCVGVLWCCGVVILCDASVCRVSTQPKLTVLSRAYWVLVCWCVLVCGCCMMLVCAGFPPSLN